MHAQQQDKHLDLSRLNDEGVASFLSGDYAGSINLFSTALNQYSALSNAIFKSDGDTMIEDSSDRDLRFSLVRQDVNPIDDQTDRGDTMLSHVFTFRGVAHLKNLSTLEESLAVGVVCSNLALCYQVRSYAQREQHTLDQTRSRTLYKTALRLCLQLCDESERQVPEDVGFLLVLLGNNLGCIGSENYDTRLTGNMTTLLSRISDFVEFPYTVVSNYLVWMKSKANPAPAA